MAQPPISFIVPDTPPFPASPRTVDLSPLKFILALIALIAIPALIYTFFFSIKCPPTPFSRRRRHHRHRSSDEILSVGSAGETASEKEVVSGVKYQKETHVKDIGSECPVCLSVFADGEDVRKLTACNHSFHAACIDMWLNSHSNCPVCRASVAVKRPSNNGTTTATRASASRDRDDLHQGLPDAATLV